MPKELIVPIQPSMPRTLDDLREWVRLNLKLDLEGETQLFEAIEEVLARQRQLVEASKLEAIQALTQSLEIEPKLRWARIALGNLYIRQGKLKEALAEFETYLAEFKKVSNRPEVEQTSGKIVAQLEKVSK